MTGICGWMSPRNYAGDHGDIQAMRRWLPPHHHTHEEASANNFSVITSSHAHDRLHQQAGLVVAVDGNPTEYTAQSKAVDAEHVAKLYTQYRDDFVKHIGGTFSVAIFDTANQRVVLAVDRTGTQPLAYSLTEAGLIFGSSATAVYANTTVARGLDHQSLYNYIYFHVIPSPRTIFKSIKKLPPAHIVTLENNSLNCTRYWQPDYTRKSKSELSGALLSTLRTAVNDASSEKQTGGFLSGGLDSSTVCGLLQQNRSTKADVFTIGFQQEGYDELEYSRIATKHFGLNLTSYYITPEDVLSAIPEVALAYDEPFGNSSAVPTLVCARLAKSAGISTLLAGDGGDELFGGNERYVTQKIFSYYDRMPKLLDKTLMRPIFFRQAVLNRDKGFQHKVRRYIEQASMTMPQRTQNYNMLHLLGASTIFNDDFLKNIEPSEPTQMLHQEYWQEGIPDQLERLLFMDYKFTLADNDLRKVNRMCELAGVSVKYPFLDDRVVAFSNSIPSRVKIKRHELRSFFKAEASAILPDEIINKTKHGFGLPFGEWLKLDKDLSHHISNNIGSLRQRGIFQTGFIDDLQNRHQTVHAAYYGNLVWVMAMLEEWLQQHNLSV